MSFSLNACTSATRPLTDAFMKDLDDLMENVACVVLPEHEEGEEGYQPNHSHHNACDTPRRDAGYRQRPIIMRHYSGSRLRRWSTRWGQGHRSYRGTANRTLNGRGCPALLAIDRARNGRCRGNGNRTTNGCRCLPIGRTGTGICRGIERRING
jgi:hypothetical protein